MKVFLSILKYISLAIIITFIIPIGIVGVVIGLITYTFMAGYKVSKDEIEKFK